MNFLYKKAILCSEKIFLPILFSIISASSSDYVLNTNFGEPIHFTITANSQSSDLVSVKENPSIRFNINSSSNSIYEASSKVSYGIYCKPKTSNSFTSYSCMIKTKLKPQFIYITKQSSVSENKISFKESNTNKFAFISSSLSNYNITLSSLSFVKLSAYDNSYSVGIINKVDLLSSIKINLLNKSTSNNYCTVKFIRGAILSDYDEKSLNYFKDKNLNDLAYL